MKRFSTAYRFGARAKDKGSGSKSVRAVGAPLEEMNKSRERRRSTRKKKMKKRKEEEIEMRKKGRKREARIGRR